MNIHEPLITGNAVYQLSITGNGTWEEIKASLQKICLIDELSIARTVLERNMEIEDATLSTEIAIVEVEGEDEQ